uniref:Uncharacterized protein n=1 Tax=Arundo donax TaxID=35708 RepID=A0A0A8XU15_ARUDO
MRCLLHYSVWGQTLRRGKRFNMTCLGVFVVFIGRTSIFVSGPISENENLIINNNLAYYIAGIRNHYEKS